jgi:hypothetical protein
VGANLYRDEALPGLAGAFQPQLPQKAFLNFTVSFPFMRMRGERLTATVPSTTATFSNSDPPWGIALADC